MIVGEFLHILTVIGCGILGGIFGTLLYRWMKKKKDELR